MRFKNFHWLFGLSKFASKRTRQRRVPHRRLAIEGLEGRRLMAVYEVNTLSDIVDASDGLFSLREAIQSSNESTAKDQIVFAASLTKDGPATIALSGNELGLYGPVEITGPSSNSLTIDAGHRSRIFTLTGEVTITNLRLTGGKAAEGGGAILSYGTTILIGCTITDSSGASGGGIFSSGTLNVWESLISNNQASASGGAIYAEGTLSIVDTTIAGNTSALAAGGIDFIDISDYLVIVNSTVSGNRAGTQGGGINGPTGTLIRMTNSIVAGNTSATNTENDIAGLSQNEVSFSLIGNAGDTGWVNGFRSSIVGVDWKTVLENDGTQPLLKDNGGRSKTIALIPGSPAIDAGYSEMFTDVALRTDQRGVGFERKSRLQVDMGAYERPKEVTSTTIEQSSPKYTDGTVTFTVNIRSDAAPNLAIGGSVRLDYFASDDDSVLIKNEQISVINGVATIVVSELDFGVYRVKATYLGDNNFQGSLSSSIQRTGRLVDYGDAPSATQSEFTNSYPVTFDQDGARHSTKSNIYLGQGLNSTEIDGVPSVNADSDLQDDGIEMLMPLIASPTVATMSSFLLRIPAIDAKLDGWIDFNRDGDWDDVGEKIADSISVFRSDYFNFTIPAGASVGRTAARFRLSSVGGLKPTGPAYDGEVEDYIVTLSSNVGGKLVLNTQQTQMVSEIVTIDGDIVLKGLPQVVLFRAPLELVGPIELEAVSANHSKWFVNNLELQFEGRLVVEPSHESDVVRLLGAGQTLKIATRSVMSADHLYAQIDIKGTGDNTLTVDSGLPRFRVLHDRGDKIDGTSLQLVSPEVIDGQFVHRLNHNPSNGRTSAIEIVNHAPFQNPRKIFDVDMDGSLAPTDVLSIINMLRRNGSGELVSPTTLDPLSWRYCDINGDNAGSPMDVLLLINELRRLGIPIQSNGIGGVGSSGTLNSSITILWGGGITADYTGGWMNYPINTSTVTLSQVQTLGSLTIQPERVVNSTGISVTGYKITIGSNLSLSPLGTGLSTTFVSGVPLNGVLNLSGVLNLA